MEATLDALVYFLVWGALIFLMMRFGCGAHVMGHQSNTEGRRSSGNLRWQAPETDTDPVCGKTVHTDQAKPSIHDGMVYYFCSRECRERFEAAPELYLGQSAQDSEKVMGEDDERSFA